MFSAMDGLGIRHVLDMFDVKERKIGGEEGGERWEKEGQTSRGDERGPAERRGKTEGQCDVAERGVEGGCGGPYDAGVMVLLDLDQQREGGAVSLLKYHFDSPKLERWKTTTDSVEFHQSQYAGLRVIICIL